MSVSILSNEQISILANFASEQNLGSAQMVGELLHNQNVKTNNERYSENVQPSFLLTDDTDTPENVIDLAFYWQSNSWADLEQSATYRKIRDIMCAAVFPKAGEQVFSDTVGKPVYYRYRGGNQLGYVSSTVNTYMVELLVFNRCERKWVTLNIMYKECTPAVGDIMDFKLSLQQVSGLKAKLKAERDAIVEAGKARMQKQAEEQQAFDDEFKKLIPTGSKSVIIAELLEDKCGHNDDYYGSETKRRVLLAFSKHTRNLFPEMRKAAARFEPTKYLSEADEKAEHRENYSMGRGTFLMKGSTYGGWRIKKVSIWNGTITKAELLNIDYSAKPVKPGKKKKPVQPKEYNLDTAKVSVDDEKGELTVSFFQQPNRELISQLQVGGLERQGDTNMVFRGESSERAIECAVAACTRNTSFLL